MCSATDSDSAPVGRLMVLLLMPVLILLPGPVNGQQDSTGSTPFKIRRAAEGRQFTDSSGTRIYQLSGDVLITRESSTIACEILNFYPDSGFALCIDSVRVSDPERKLFCDSLFYYADSGYYRAVGSLRWKTDKLHGSGRQGEYWRDTDLFRVTGEAYAADSTRRMYSERMEYDYEAEVLRAEGAVRFEDIESGSEAAGASAMYRSSDELLVLRGRPVLTYYEEEDSLRSDPFNLTGDVVTAYGSDSLVSSGRVRLWQDSLTVTSDSLFHDRSSNTSYFRGGPPRVLSPEYSLKAEVLDVFSEERSLDRIVATGDGRGEFWTATDDSLEVEDGEKYVSWIEGDSLRLFFGENAMDSIYATGNAHSYYQESAGSGINYVQGGMILLIFAERQLDVVEVREGGRGVYLPPDTGGTITVIPDSAGFSSPPDSTPPP